MLLLCFSQNAYHVYETIEMCMWEHLWNKSTILKKHHLLSWEQLQLSKKYNLKRLCIKTTLSLNNMSTKPRNITFTRRALKNDVTFTIDKAHVVVSLHSVRETECWFLFSCVHKKWGEALSLIKFIAISDHSTRSFAGVWNRARSDLLKYP